jgi:hypothetical protein
LKSYKKDYEEAKASGSHPPPLYHCLLCWLRDGRRCEPHDPVQWAHEEGDSTYLSSSLSLLFYLYARVFVTADEEEEEKAEIQELKPKQKRPLSEETIAKDEKKKPPERFWWTVINAKDGLTLQPLKGETQYKRQKIWFSYKHALMSIGKSEHATPAEIAPFVLMQLEAAVPDNLFDSAASSSSSFAADEIATEQASRLDLHTLTKTLEWHGEIPKNRPP